MTITLTMEEEWELWQKVDRDSLPKTELESFEILSKMPKQLGKGYTRTIELYPQLWLTILDYEYRDDLLIKIPDWDHPLEFFVLLSGSCIDEYGGQVGEGYTCISGSGIQRQMMVRCLKSRHVGVELHMSPELLRTFFPNEAGAIPPQLRLLAKGDDWQTLIHPEMTTAVQEVTQQILNCPYQGIMKRMYLQAKVLELMTLQLAPILTSESKLHSSPRLKAATIARLHHAKEILLSRLENPPSLLELAQMVGVSDRTLRRGFQELYSTTVFGYLANQRMSKAQRLLREEKLTVAEVAMMVGYSNPSHFAEAFKRQFGMTPRECLAGKLEIALF